VAARPLRGISPTKRGINNKDNKIVREIFIVIRKKLQNKQR
jgi:hypothetical protein